MFFNCYQLNQSLTNHPRTGRRDLGDYFLSQSYPPAVERLPEGFKISTVPILYIFMSYNRKNSSILLLTRLRFLSPACPRQDGRTILQDLVGRFLLSVIPTTDVVGQESLFFNPIPPEVQGLG